MRRAEGLAVVTRRGWRLTGAGSSRPLREGSDAGGCPGRPPAGGALPALLFKQGLLV